MTEAATTGTAPGAAALHMDVLAMQLLVGTQAAAAASRRWVGRGDPHGADRAAVAAMRRAFARLPGLGTVVIGEGAKDDAPMLYVGETVGAGGDAVFDLAVDPLENTTACARDADGAIAVVAAAPSGALWGSGAAWYMDKLVVGPDAADRVDIDRPVEDNLRAVAAALGKPVEQVTAVVLDKPRHVGLIRRVRAAGARVRLIPGGDVAGALRVVLPDHDADVLLGVGGAPEGVLAACAVRLLGGGMQARLAPQSEAERDRVLAAGHDLGAPLGIDDLVASRDCCFVATSVTWQWLDGSPERPRSGHRTRSLVATPLHPCLVVESLHHPERTTYA